MSAALLEVRGLGVRFGGVQALAGVDMSVAQGSVHGLIGPNGAGKTTLLNCITGLIAANEGSIRFKGHDLGALPAHAIVGLGIARTFQNFGLMEELSVRENVIAGLHSRNPCRLLDEVLLFQRRNRAERAMHELAQEHLQAAGLAPLADVPVKSLPYGKRKAVELARATAVGPELLLLDEPTAGLSEPEMAALADRLQRLRSRSGTTLLVISHHMGFLLGIAEQVTVLNLGRPVATGSAQAIQADPAVIAAYLGVED